MRVDETGKEGGRERERERGKNGGGTRTVKRARRSPGFRFGIKKSTIRE